MYRGHSVAVVVPAYNEEAFVGEVIETMPAFVDRVYVVDDCSTDGTWGTILEYATAEPLPSGHEAPVETWRGHRVVTTGRRSTDAVADGGAETIGQRLIPIQHAENRGVGGSILTGYRRALEDGVDVTAVMAGDGQMDPDYLDRLLDPIVEGRAAYAKGNRLLGREYYEAMSSFRLFGNLTLTVLTKISSGYWKMLDPQNGYTAISHDALDALDLDDLYEDYGFTNDILVSLNTHEFTIADVAMPAVYGEERSHIEYRTFVPMLSWLLFRRFCRRLGVRYLLRDFHPLTFLYAIGTFGTAASLTGLAASVGSRREADSTVANVLTSILLGVLSATCVVLAMIFDREANADKVVSVE